MSKEELRHCRYCGGAARVRYDSPFHWVECKKCKAATRAYSDWGEHNDPDSRRDAIEDWNNGEIFQKGNDEL